MGDMSGSPARAFKEPPRVSCIGLVRDTGRFVVQTLRALNARTVNFCNIVAGRTGSRAGPGKPIRWSESWVQALQEAAGIENPTRDHGMTRERAQIVATMLEYGRLHGRKLAL